MFCDLDESCVDERGGVVGQAGGAQVGEDAEGQIEAADDEPRGKAHRAWRNLEIGDDPESSGCERGVDAGNERIELGLREAVEEEVCNYQVVGARRRTLRRECQGGGLVGLKAGVGSGRCGFAVAAEQKKHGGADVDGVCVKVGVASEELSEETAVSVAEDQGIFPVEKTREKVKTATLERSTQGEALEQAVGAGDMVEVRGRDLGLKIGWKHRSVDGL